MLHLSKKSNKVIGDNQLLEKRVKKLEKGLEHTNVEVSKLKDIVMGGLLNTGSTNGATGGSTSSKPLPDLDLDMDMSGLDDI